MPRSIKIIILILALFIIGLLGFKYLLRSNKWVYLKVATYSEKDKMVERQWLDLDGRWYSKSSNDSSLALPMVDDKKWSTDRFLYIALIKGGKETKWLRKHFTIKEEPNIDTLLLRLSLFDIHARVYVNGTKIADSGFVYNNSICFKLPSKLLNYPKPNLIAVQASKILNNSESVVKLKDEIIVTLKPSVSLEGEWKIAKGDLYIWKNPNINDLAFWKISVPAKWDGDSLKNYDGIAWYRKKFITPSQFRNEELVLIAGKIDDFNEIFINGTKIGGNVFKRHHFIRADDWTNWVIYRFKSTLLTDTNTIAVRVNDVMLDGGIYQGPVGILTLDEYYHFFK